MAATPKGRRQRNKPWKGVYGTDRKYTARVDRAADRGQYTAPKEKQSGQPDSRS